MSAHHLIFVFVLIIACGSNPKEGEQPKQDDKIVPVALSGAKIFKQYCVLCHGADGKLGLNGSKDLTLSEMPLDSVLYQIRNGKGTMLPYKDVLSDAEIDSVSNYVVSLRKNE